jgi:hypothetical protein
LATASSPVGSPVTERRGPNNSPSLNRRQASVCEIRSRIPNASAQLRAPNSPGLDCAFTAAITRCCTAGIRRFTVSRADCTSNSSATDASSNATVDSLSTVANRSTTPSMTRTLVRTTDKTGSYPQSRIHPQIHPHNGFGSGKRVDSACDNEV